MKSFEILDHPADIGIKIYGESIEELFKNAAIGTSSLLIESETIEANITKNINIQGYDREELLINWLDKIVYIFDANRFLVKNISNLVINSKDGFSLKAVVHGESFNKYKHTIKLYLKGVTYHQLQLKQLDDKSWEAVVYFDV